MKKRTIVLNMDFGEKNLARLTEEFPQFSFHMYDHNVLPPEELLKESEVLLVHFSQAAIPYAVNAKWVHTCAAGVDGFIELVQKSAGPDTLMTNGTGVYAVPISEHLLTLMLALSRNIKPCVQGMAQGVWQKGFKTKEIWGSTVGILGLGDIGLALARIVKPMGARVLGYKRTPMDKPDYVDDLFYGDDGLDAMLSQCDYLCVALPGTPFTRGLIDARRIGLMKPGVIITNIGRGYIIDTDAMVAALRSGQIGGAGLDVTDPEPLPSDHPLWQEPNALITPHFAGTSPYQDDRKTDVFMENLRAYAAGEPLPSAVNLTWRY